MMACLSLKTYMKCHVSWSYSGKSRGSVEDKADRLLGIPHPPRPLLNQESSFLGCTALSF